MIQLPYYVQTALRTLEKNGYSAYCVGGCVRDSLLDKKPQDWDIATSATPLESCGVFADFQTIKTGLQHGTITVILDGHTMEITTFRIDGDYLDSRHPETVSFTTDIEADLARRDFTINAMAYSDKSGIIDPYGGRTDLQRGLLRCVGDAGLRFSEDALRILRCVRFSSQLGFSIDPDTYAAAISACHQLSRISAERIQVELSKTLCGSYAEGVLRENAPILFSVLPELQPMEHCGQEMPYHIYDVWEHTLHALGASSAQLPVRLALLLHDSGKPAVKTFDHKGQAHFYGHAEVSTQIARDILRRLRYPKRLQELVCSLVKHHDHILPFKRMRIKRLLQELGAENFFSLMEVMRGDLSAQHPDLLPVRLPMLSQTIEAARDLLDNNACLSLSQLAINGRDLQDLGCPDGKRMGELLHELLDLVILEQVPNERERLLKIARRRLSQSYNS